METYQAMEEKDAAARQRRRRRFSPIPGHTPRLSSYYKRAAVIIGGVTGAVVLLP